MAVAAERERDWQTGKVLDSQRSRYFAGTVGNANTTGIAQANGNYGTYQGKTNTTQTAVYRTYENFVIEGDTLVYLAQERLRWKWRRGDCRYRSWGLRGWGLSWRGSLGWGLCLPGRRW